MTLTERPAKGARRLREAVKRRLDERTLVPPADEAEATDVAQVPEPETVNEPLAQARDVGSFGGPVLPRR